MRRSVIWTDPEDEATSPKSPREEVTAAKAPKLEEPAIEDDEPVIKDEEVSADVDRMMDKITELRRLTRESLEVEVERLSAELGRPSPPASPSAGKKGTLKREQSPRAEQSPRPSPPASPSAGKKGTLKREQSPSQVAERSASKHSVATSKHEEHSSKHEASDRSEAAERLTPSLEDGSVVSSSGRRTNVKTENSRPSSVSSSLAPTRRGRSDSVSVFEGLQAFIQQVQSLGDNRRRDAARNADAAGSESMVSESFVSENITVDDILDDFRNRIINMEKEIRAWSGHLEESELRITTEVFAKLDQKIEEKLHMQIPVLESQAQLPLSSSPEASPGNLDSPGTAGEVPASARQKKGSGKAARASSSPSGRSSTPTQRQTAARLRQPGMAANAATGAQLADLKSQVLADIGAEIDVLRQEVSGISGMEDRMKKYVSDHLRAEARARKGGHQELMREIENQSKVRVSDSVNIWKVIGSSNFRAPQDLSSVGSDTVPSEHSGSAAKLPKPDASEPLTNGRVSESELSGLNATTGPCDTELVNVASRCAGLAQTLSSGDSAVDEQVRRYVLQLSNDLKNVSTYLSGALQVQLKGMSENIGAIQGKLANVIHVPTSTKPSESATAWSPPKLQIPKAPLLPLSIPRSGSPEEAEEVELGSQGSSSRFPSPAQYFRSPVSGEQPVSPWATPRQNFRGLPAAGEQPMSPWATPVSPFSTPRQNLRGEPQASPSMSPRATPRAVAPSRAPLPTTSFAPSLQALGPGTPGTVHRTIDAET